MDEFSHEERFVENIRKTGAGNCLHIRRRNVQKVGPKTEEFLIERLGTALFYYDRCVLGLCHPKDWMYVRMTSYES